MSMFGKSSHALYFNGVNDSVVCPQGGFTQTGHKLSLDGNDARTSAHVVNDGDALQHIFSKNQSLTSFTVEAWVSPDCGGVIAIKEGSFALRIGSVGAPAPASFEVTLDNGVTVAAFSKHNYPTSAESFITNNNSVSTAQRELYYVCGVFTGEQVKLYVNGEIMAAEKLNGQYRTKVNEKDLYIGGEGGQYRGFIESVHWQRGAKSSDLRPLAFMKTSSTIGLWRFEEPVEVDENVYHIKSDATAGATTLTLDATQVQTLYRSISGKSDTFTGTYTPENLGNYRVMNSNRNDIDNIAHRQINLIINPTGADINTALPNNKPPERVRLVSIQATGTITVESVHLDYNTTPLTGLRGILHARTAYHTPHNLAHDSTIVVVRSDLLIDSQSGKPYQMEGMGTQAIDRNGSMVVDESGNDFHGFIYSRGCSVNESGNPFTVSSANWSIDNKFQRGHNGRHKYNHVEGKSFLRMLPPSSKDIITRTIDGVADSMRATFPAAHIGIKDQLPINSRVDMSYTAFNGSVRSVKTNATTTHVVPNGMRGISGVYNDGIIAIGVDDIRPFLLKGFGVDNVTNDSNTHIMHLLPEDKSRVAIMQVSGITSLPYVEIHYNAIDLTGSKMGVNKPCLLVEKTVPSANATIDGKTVAEHIEDAVGATIHSAGGVVTISKDSVGDAHTVMQPHRLVGDNTGGSDKELELDESRIPANYTPADTTDLPRTAPLAIQSSNASTTHPSVYHRLILQPNGRAQSDPPINEAPAHYQEQVQFVSQQGAAFEVFDIIDNYKVNDEHHIIVQPSQKDRSMQLSRTVGSTDDAKDHTYASVEFIQGQGRVNSFQIVEKKGTRDVVMRMRGLMADVADQSSSYTGDASPDSHGVKEIMPGAPVVSVTLGGAGQGAINTKPSWDPSSLARIGWNTRKDCSVKVYRVQNTSTSSLAWPYVKTATIEVNPLNNESANLASWGTYCFPPVGKIHLPNGAFAHYESRTGTSFTFNLEWNAYALKYGHEGTFVNSNGTTADSMNAWVTTNKVEVGKNLLLDPLYDEQGVCADGTTVNDRLFQSLGTVAHDYQLGTQYASTRALVEIPIFPNQFFEDRERGIFPGPGNSMKIHLDPTMTAHTWSPSPVGRRATNKPSIDHEAYGAYYERSYNDEPIRVEVAYVSQIVTSGTVGYTARLKVGHIARMPKSSLTASGSVSGLNAQNWLRKVYLDNGEWCYYIIDDTSGGREDSINNRIELLSFASHHSENFFQDLQTGSVLTVGQLPFKIYKPLLTDSSQDTLTSANEYRKPFYYDRANTQTQGGNIDYGLRQYVSAVEFKAGPLSNPHIARIESGVTRIKVVELTSVSSPQVLRFEHVNGVLPRGQLPSGYDRYSCVNETTGEVMSLVYDSSADENQVTVYHSVASPVVGDTLAITGITTSTATQFPQSIQDGCANQTWNYPFCPGGLRYGDTVWMNMHYTNPHATEGLFAKSRGVLNEYQVWTGFNGGKGDLATQARDSLPLENFLIGNTCIETARNFVQHVNETIRLNWVELGHATDPPVVAYLDPYLSTEQHSRVLLYDVAHDREFIAFHDLHMQVQSSATTPVINELDVAAGFATQRKDKKPSRSGLAAETIGGVSYSLEKTHGHSQFVEGAYAHTAWYFMDYDYLTASTGQYVRGARQTQHWVKTASVDSAEHDRIEPSVTDDRQAQLRHAENMLKTESNKIIESLNTAYRFTSRFFDTPDGTRVIPAFLCMKGKRSSDLTISSNSESSRLQNLPHWYAMDFARRLTIDFGEVGIKDGVTDIEAAAKEIVRLINQAGAKNGKSSQRRPSDQYPGEGERFDINRRAVSASGENTFEPSDPTSAHHHADFATTGSTHDPAPFWDDSAFTSYDRGSHMGYLRAHIGRVVEDIDGNEGFSIIVHSTVPGASGRNFCAWMDNSKGQTEYKPQFLIGHGGHFRNFFCSQPEIAGENMHPAPMPIDKNGKPFAPITTLRQHLPIDEVEGDVKNSQNLGHDENLNTNTTTTVNDGSNATPNSDATTGRNSNSINMESFEEEGQKYTVREGLQRGTTASARINFGGIVAAGVPGFCADAGKWGFGEDGDADTRFSKIYGQNIPADNVGYSIYSKYILADQVDTDNIGVGTNMYGLKLTDHLGKNHIIRYVYRQEGVKYTHPNSPIPPTMDEEIVVHFDDRDVSQGGFTLGSRMWGKGANGTPVEAFIDPSAGVAESYRGNTFRGVHAPNNGYAVTVSPKTILRVGPLSGTGHAITAAGTSGYAAATTYNVIMQSRIGGGNGIGGQIQVTVNGSGQVTGITALTTPGTGYAVGDVLTIDGGSRDATITVATTGTTPVYAHPASIILATGSGIGDYNTGIWHRLPDVDDVLGWLGFPDRGLLWLAVDDGNNTADKEHRGICGRVFQYEGRTHENKSGTHAFFGLRGLGADDIDSLFTATSKMGPQSSSDTKNPVTISPYLNQTTLVTDELIAAATNAAFEFGGDEGEVMKFDCSDMFTPDGRTYADWMGEKAQTAITIKAFNPKKKVLPLKDLFKTELSEDWGIVDSSIQTSTSASSVANAGANIHMGGLTRQEVNAGVMFDAGYLPQTLLHITTRYRGHNANTATPVIVDYNNNPLNINEWKKHLRGEYFTSNPGDHITPSFNNMPIRLREETVGPILYATANSGGMAFWEEGKEYDTATATGSGSGARHTIFFDWRGPRLTNSMISGGEGYAVGDTYRIWDYQLGVGDGAIQDVILHAPTQSNGYKAYNGLNPAGSPPLPSFTLTNAGTGIVASGVYDVEAITGNGIGGRLAITIGGGGAIAGITAVRESGYGYQIGDTIKLLAGNQDSIITLSSVVTTTYSLSATSPVGAAGTGANNIQLIVDEVGITLAGKPSGVQGFTAGSGYCLGDTLSIQGLGSTNDASIEVSKVANLGANYSASTTYNLQVGGVTKGQAQFDVDSNGALIGIKSPLIAPVSYGYGVGQSLDVVDPAGTGSGGKVKIRRVASSLFTVQIIEGIDRYENQSYRWDAGGDFFLGPYGREKAFQSYYLQAGDRYYNAATGFPREFNWVSPTKLFVTEEDSMLVQPVGDKIRFLGADTTEGIGERVWRRTTEHTQTVGVGSRTSSYEGIDANTLRIFGQRYNKGDKRVSGIRLAGSTEGEPLTYFRGAHDSTDHSIPLYFGGGFSGVTLDINDGSKTDYTSHNKHPYASGPTGSAGMQNIGEKMGAYALLDTTAMMAMFPGTPLCDQMHGSSIPPFANQDAILSTDMNGATHTAIGATYTDVKVVKPTPIVLRFAHPYARYTDANNSVAYIIFGPGQAAPKHWKGESQSMSTSVEPSAKWTVAAQHYMTRNGSTATYNITTENAIGLPNELGNTALGGGANQFLPKTTTYNANDVAPHKTFTHWETPLGSPNALYNQTTAAQSLYVTNHFGTPSTNDTAATIYAHPYSHYKANQRFTATYFAPPPGKQNKAIFHLDGGYAPGGSWFDNTVRKNPPHPITGAIIQQSQTATINSASVTTGLNATMFRVGAAVTVGYDTDANTSPPLDTFLIDATRCQNSEELGAIIAAGINTWPGPANLKAIGGSFLPSFQDAQKQDRYGWVNCLAFQEYDGTNGIVTASNPLPDTLPDSGWIRVSNAHGGGTDVFYGYYAHRTSQHFILGANYRSNQNVLEDPTKSTAAGSVANGVVSTLSASGHQIHVWSKTGNLRWDNGIQKTLISSRSTGATAADARTNSAYDHFATTQVHFSGVTDAIDRTRAVGAVGWHGERYSYLNSLSVDNKLSAGLGAWLPASGFNPYGPSQACHTINSVKYAVQAQPDGTENSVVVVVPIVESHPATSGVHQRHYIAISYEGDLPIIAKAARNGQSTCGDMLQLKWRDTGTGTGTMGGTVVAYHNERFNNDRYSAESNAGPHVEALYDSGRTQPDGNGVTQSGASTQDTLFQMDSCLFPTGDLFFNMDVNPGVKNWSDSNESEVLFDAEKALSKSYGYDNYQGHLTSAMTYGKTRYAARNFFVEHVVWKRMGGGNLTLPAPNARGLGAIPWTVHKVGGSYIKFGETIYGNTRFSFETTNHSMFPIIQAQELAHPSLAEQFPYEIRNALAIPNEELQFEQMTVVDDTGQQHTLAGGSPLGIVIRDFKTIQDRATEGLAPSVAGSGEEPNMQIQLPNHNGIPSNILVRSGFDRLQAYQHEAIGEGGLQHPSQPSASVNLAFSNDGKTPTTAPYWEQLGYEHIDPHPNTFPDSTNKLNEENILKTAYEPHDRALYFHITKMGYSYTEREPLGIVNGVMTHNPLTVNAIGTDYITVNETITESIWEQNPTRDGRYFLSINGTIATFTATANDAPLGERFTGVVFAPDFTAVAGDTIKPSYYIPAGTTRHFAARRLRDHAEGSGNSPDKPLTNWMSVGATASPATAVRAANKLTPMPLPRMGHHYVTPTMATMPGHLAHPAYQVVGQKSFACAAATPSAEQQAGYADVEQHRDTLVWFSGVTAPSPPSDIHGDGFTLLTETKIRFDGYGIADDSAACNAAGGHRISLEVGTNYNTSWNFPDPLEVGAYQIVIQPNLFSQQLMGNNANTVFASTSAPVNAAGAAQTTKPLLTDQFVATVVALQWNSDRYDLILSEATMADVRGCEIYLNELMLDVDPSSREQFTNIPLLGLQNPFGINASSSGAFTRRSLPYHPNMFRRATPARTVTVPWWAVAYDQATVFGTNNWMQTEQYHPDDYYLFCRSTLGGVGCQLTMTGYPSHYLDVYTEYLVSLTPTCTIKRLDNGSSPTTRKIFVDNNALFPLAGSGYKNHKLAIEGTDGVTYYLTYVNRGYSSNPTAGSNTTVFEGVTASAYVWSKIDKDLTVRLTGPSATILEGDTYKKSNDSVATRNLPQLLTGTRDTNSGNPADAYLCLWHYNLGRPMTWFSDSRATATLAAVDQAPYNHLPEHFETVHYHEFVYAMSDGPFKFRMRGWNGPGEALVETWTDTSSAPVYPHQAGVDGKSRQYHYGSFWPGGHRFGAQMSSMTLYGTAALGWGTREGQILIDDGASAKANKGLQITATDPSTLTDSINTVNTKRRIGMGYRVSVRQPYNRPRWAIKSGQSLRDPYASYHFNADGPFVSQETGTGSTFTESQSASAVDSSVAYTASYTGILERHTNASALIGSDIKGQQVRYSHGRRMTKSFGCAVRNIINPTTGFRLFHGDTPAGLEGTDVTDQRVSLALAQAHYMVDWWGNTTGEEVRRFPVRGFGIRPSWDPEDAYHSTDRTVVSDEAMVAQRSTTGAALAVVDFYDPKTAKRVGDRGDGRGVRWPTVFNEDILQSVDTKHQLSGMVLSHHTSEPPFTSGYIRASNLTLQNYEVPRGISNRLGIAADDGLLQPAAMVGSNTASTEAGFLPSNLSIQEPISRASPKIGIDAQTIDQVDKTYAIIGTEAVSLHTDRAVGQRFILEGGVNAHNRTLGDYDLTALDLRNGPDGNKQVMRFGQTHGVPVIGGSFILEVSSYTSPISDLGWGRANDDSSNRTTNPYQTTNNNPLSVRTNIHDKSIKFLLRPVRVLDNKHIELFRTDRTHFLSATSAGRYGMFTYDAPSARATETDSTFLRATNPSPTNAPYPPVLLFDEGSGVRSDDTPVSFGPKLPGSKSATFVSNIKQAVSRMVISVNTLQHYRGDASRKQSVSNSDESFIRHNYSVQPRFTQSLYPGDAQNTTNHASESNRADNELV